MKRPLTILEILFPRVRAEILRLLFSEPARQRYVRELMTMSGLALRTVQEELANLSAAGLITSWTNGYHRFYRANRDHKLFPISSPDCPGQRSPAACEESAASPKTEIPAKTGLGFVADWSCPEAVTFHAILWKTPHSKLDWINQLAVDCFPGAHCKS